MSAQTYPASGYPFIDALQAPVKWGVAQFKVLPENLTGGFTVTAFLQLLLLVPAVLAILIGAIPYLCGTIAKKAKHINFLVISNQDDLAKTVATSCRELSTRLIATALKACANPKSGEESDQPEVYIVKVRRKQLKVFESDQALSNFKSHVIDRFKHGRKQRILFVTNTNNLEQPSKSYVTSVLHGEESDVRIINNTSGNDEKIISECCAREINSWLR